MTISIEVGGETTRGREVIFPVDGMTCGACAARIERRLNQIDGVRAAVSYASESATVELEPRAQFEEVVRAITALGYETGDPARSADAVTELPAKTGGQVDPARTLGRRLVVAGLLFMPLCDLSLLFWLMPVARFPGWQWLLIVIAAPVVTWCAWPFYRAAVHHLRRGTFSMDTLVSLGIVVSTLWSLYAMFWQQTNTETHTFAYLFTHHTDGAIYIDVAAGVTTFLLAGRYFEARIKRRTRNSLKELASVGAKWVCVLEDDHEVLHPIESLTVGQDFVVRPGETVATDGMVIDGRASLDRRTMTGESLPVDTAPGDQVIGGTVSIDGRLIVRAEKIGRDTQLAHMVRLVERAQTQKADVQRLADRIAGVFVPTVLVIAVATLTGWLLAGAPPSDALNAALSVLIIACPCALGLATPMALLIASGEGARLGIFFKGYQGVEGSRQVDTVVLDKTGTVTTGTMEVTDLCPVQGITASELLAWAGAVEQASEHLVGRAVSHAALTTTGPVAPVSDFVALPGVGARGVVRNRTVLVGRPGSWTADAVPAELAAAKAAWEDDGATVVFVQLDGEPLGAIALEDRLRPSAAAAVADLHALGLRCVLLTGDNRTVAQKVAASIGVDEVVAEALPMEKVDRIRELQTAGSTVAVVGDGINDGPAIASSDLGLAVGSGTDVALNAADLIVMRDDLRAVPLAIALARSTLRTIRGNLAWAFAYNVAAIPIAACGLLNPLIAGAAMAFSSGFVVWNSTRIGKRARIPRYSEPRRSAIGPPQPEDSGEPLRATISA